MVVKNTEIRSVDLFIKREDCMDPQCPLCGVAGKSMDHLFFSCPYSRQAIYMSLSVAGNLIPPDSFSSMDSIDLLLCSIKKRSKAWGIQWSLIATIVWGLWKKWNTWKKTIRRNCEQIAKSYIKMVFITFKELCFKKTHGTRRRQSPTLNRRHMQCYL